MPERTFNGSNSINMNENCSMIVRTANLPNMRLKLINDGLTNFTERNIKTLVNMNTKCSQTFDISPLTLKTNRSNRVTDTHVPTVKIITFHDKWVQ